MTYSNAALLEMMRVHVVEEAPSVVHRKAVKQERTVDSRRRSPFGTFPIGDGAMLMPYETLINPPGVESPALHWPG